MESADQKITQNTGAKCKQRWHAGISSDVVKNGIGNGIFRTV